jgi:hypothetical protein
MEPNTTTMLPLPELSPEVLAFAKEKGVSAYLPAIREMTRKLFPQAAVQVFVQEDAELLDIRQIIFQVDFTELDPPDSVDAIRKWNRGLFKDCPATHVHVFCLGTYRTR